MSSINVWLCGAAFLCIPIVHATTITFSTPSGLLGTSQTYGTGITIVATGYNASGTQIDLYGKHNGGDESGVGLTNDPSGDDEITPGSFVQLNLSNLISNGVSAVTITMDSTTNGETWKICDDTTAGSLSNCTNAITGSSENYSVLVTSIATYLDITAVGKDNSGATANVLLNSLTYDTSSRGTEGTVPEPFTFALTVSGLATLFLLRRWRLRKAAEI